MHEYSTRFAMGNAQEKLAGCYENVCCYVNVYLDLGQVMRIWYFSNISIWRETLYLGGLQTMKRQTSLHIRAD